MPALGYGVLQLRDSDTCERCVIEALHAGNRLLDTAASYCNEVAVGRAVTKAGIPRDEIFVTTKLWIQDSTYQKTITALEKSMKNLQMDYIDLYLIHQPFGDYYDAWRAMEQLYQDGKIRAIGVSNFDEARLVDLCMNSRIRPMVNQIELHPFHQQCSAIRSMREWQVQPQAWAPFCEGLKLIFQNEIFANIGRKYEKSAAQVILRWNVQRGVVVIPGSQQVEHIRENLDIWDFTLSDDEILEIQRLDLGYSEIINHHAGYTAKWLNEFKIPE